MKPDEPTFPSYPVMIITLEGGGPDYLMKCSCGYRFVVDAVTEDNLVSWDGHLRECCPNCFAMHGMDPQDHVNALTECQVRISSLYGRERPRTASFAGFVHAIQDRVTALLKHASDALEADRRVMPTADHIHRAIMGRPLIPGPINWKEAAGPFPMFPKQQVEV